MHPLFVRCEHLLGQNLILPRQPRSVCIIKISHFPAIEVISVSTDFILVVDVLNFFKLNEVALLRR